MSEWLTVSLCIDRGKVSDGLMDAVGLLIAEIKMQMLVGLKRDPVMCTLCAPT